PELRARFTRRIPLAVLGNLALPAIDAGIVAWTSADAWFDRVMAVLSANRATVAAALAGGRLAPLTGHAPEGTYLAWLDGGGLDPGRAPGAPLADLLREGAGVALSDGAAFSPRTADHVRLNFATSPEILDRILDRVASGLGRLGLS
ncbi:MAG: hypothetical protein AB7L84_02075, partial [Acidimicrobiia bacterium]